MVYDPGHPDADPEGYVAMPDVQMPMEMVDMLTASRAYEANLAAIGRFRKLCEEALKLLR
jgi:flagellar basal-body rod protein FlgC